MCRLRTQLLAPLLITLLAWVLAPTQAHARLRPKRTGGQAEILSGVSMCVPGAAKCRQDSAGLEGRTAPMVGFGVNAGYRFRRTFFTGLGYSAGFFNPRYELTGGSGYRLAYQQGLFLVLRGILPVGRLDLGLEVSPGASRAVLRPEAPDNVKIYTQGFALRPGLSVDVWLGRQLFLGAKADLTLNLHRNTCTRIDDSSTCAHKEKLDVVAVHQLIIGLHIGGTF